MPGMAAFQLSGLSIMSDGTIAELPAIPNNDFDTATFEQNCELGRRNELAAPQSLKEKASVSERNPGFFFFAHEKCVLEYG